MAEITVNGFINKVRKKIEQFSRHTINQDKSVLIRKCIFFPFHSLCPHIQLIKLQNIKYDTLEFSTVSALIPEGQIGKYIYKNPGHHRFKSR